MGSTPATVEKQGNLARDELAIFVPTDCSSLRSGCGSGPFGRKFRLMLRRSEGIVCASSDPIFGREQILQAVVSHQGDHEQIPMAALVAVMIMVSISTFNWSSTSTCARTL
ncbi:hypothetical protein ABIB00_001833 [Bradyrhizobium sp. LB14.3]